MGLKWAHVKSCHHNLHVFLVHIGKLSYLSLLFFITLHSDEYIFPFLPCLSLLFFPRLFVRLPQTSILPFCICFLLGIVFITAS